MGETYSYEVCLTPRGPITIHKVSVVYSIVCMPHYSLVKNVVIGLLAVALSFTAPNLAS